MILVISGRDSLFQNQVDHPLSNNLANSEVYRIFALE
jgi:hypothetical protein